MNEGKLTIKGKIGKGAAQRRGSDRLCHLPQTCVDVGVRAPCLFSFFSPFLRAFLPEIVPPARSPVIPFQRPRGAGFYLGLLFGAVCRENGYTDFIIVLFCL